MIEIEIPKDYEIVIVGVVFVSILRIFESRNPLNFVALTINAVTLALLFYGYRK